MICKNCKDEFDIELFSICPYCLYDINENNKIRQVQVLSNNEKDDKLVNVENSHLLKSSFDNLEDRETLKLIKIEDLFFENNLNKFRIHCNRSNIKYVSEITDTFIEDSLTVRGLGVGKINLIKNKLADYSKNTMVSNINQFSDNGSLNINLVFNEIGLRPFIEYCHTNGIVSVYDLNTIDIKLLTSIKGLTKDNYEKVIQICDQEACFFEEVHDDLIDLSVEFLKFYGLKSGSIKKLKNKKILLLKDLIGIKKIKLSRIIANEKQFSILIGLDKILGKGIVNNLNYYFETIKYTNEYDILLKRANKITLEEIGNIYGITRERIRQINKRTIENIFILKTLFINRRNVLYDNELIVSFPDKDIFIIVKYLLLNSDYYSYLDFFNIYVSTNIVPNIEESLRTIATDFIGESVDYYENSEKLEEILLENKLGFLNAVTFLDFTLSIGYKLYNNILYSRGNVSYGYLFSLIIKEYYPNGVKLHSGAEFDELKLLFKKKYPTICIDDKSDRTLTSRMTDFLVLCGKGSFISENNIYIEHDLLEEIIVYIDEFPTLNINYSTIYDNFQGKLKMFSDINNHHFLHGVLLLFYPDKYKYSREYLVKYDTTLKYESTADKLKCLINKLKRPITHYDLKNNGLNYSDSIIYNTIINDNDLFYFDTKSYSSLKLVKMKDDDLNKITMILDDLLFDFNGAITSKLFYKMISISYKEFLDNYGLENNFNLFNLISKFKADNYHFSSRYIAIKNKFNVLSTRNVILNYYKNRECISFNELNDIKNKLLINEMSFSNSFYEIITDYHRINSDCYVFKNEFVITESEILEINNVVEKLCIDYLSLLNFSYWSLLPDINYEWNPFLLRTILENYSKKYNIIDPQIKNRLYEKGVIISKDLDIQDYSQLVIHIIKSLNRTSISEEELSSLLIIKGLTYQNIPKEIYNSNKLSYKNNTFYIQIQQ